ncbi:MAG: O-antigen ligase family protein [Mariprofundaceae bacterium]|nr:O-antigen ligase family protein [Mariprofundaceae bacterium]
MLITILLVSLLLVAAYMVAPEAVYVPMLVCGGVMVMFIAFTNVELTIYLVIMSTLLSPEIGFGGGGSAEGGTTSSRGLTIRVDDILLTLVCLTWLFRMAAGKQLNLVRSTPINQPILCYWGATVLATTVGFYAGYVKGIYGPFFVIKYLEYFILFYVIVNDVHDFATLRRYMAVMMFTCFVTSLVGLEQVAEGGRVSAPFEGEEGEPNTFGGYLVLMFAVALGMFFEEKNKQAQRRWLILLGFIIIPFVFTESRSSYLAFMAMGITFFVFSQHKRTLIVCGFIALLVVPMILPQGAIDRVAYTFSQKEQIGQMAVGGVHVDTSTSARLNQWKKALTVYFPSHPIIGRGVTGAGFMDAQYARVLSETGIIGLLTFLWLLSRMLGVFRQGYRELEDGRMRGAALGGLCGLCGLMVHAIGGNSFIIVRIMEPLMILLGLVMAALLIQRKEQQENAVPNGASGGSLEVAR